MYWKVVLMSWSGPNPVHFFIHDLQVFVCLVVRNGPCGRSFDNSDVFVR